MKFVLCDDDSRFLQREEALVRAYFTGHGIEADVVTVGSGETLLALEPDFDVLFLDMQLAEHSGIDLARALRQRNQDFLLVIVSGSVDFALQGYGVTAFRYLLKSDLHNTLEHCLQDLLHLLAQNKAAIRLDFVDWDGPLLVNDILYVESRKHRAVFHLRGRRHTCHTYEPLAVAEQALEGQPFVRVHKSYLVHMKYIHTLQAGRLELTDGTVVPVARARAEAVRRAYILYRSGSYD